MRLRLLAGACAPSPRVAGWPGCCGPANELRALCAQNRDSTSRLPAAVAAAAARHVVVSSCSTCNRVRGPSAADPDSGSGACCRAISSRPRTPPSPVSTLVPTPAFRAGVCCSDRGARRCLLPFLFPLGIDLGRGAGLHPLRAFARDEFHRVSLGERRPTRREWLRLRRSCEERGSESEKDTTWHPLRRRLPRRIRRSGTRVTAPPMNAKFNARQHRRA